MLRTHAENVLMVKSDFNFSLRFTSSSFSAGPYYRIR